MLHTNKAHRHSNKIEQPPLKTLHFYGSIKKRKVMGNFLKDKPIPIEFGRNKSGGNKIKHIPASKYETLAQAVDADCLDEELRIRIEKDPAGHAHHICNCNLAVNYADVMMNSMMPSIKRNPIKTHIEIDITFDDLQTAEEVFDLFKTIIGDQLRSRSTWVLRMLRAKTKPAVYKKLVRSLSKLGININLYDSVHKPFIAKGTIDHIPDDFILLFIDEQNANYHDRFDFTLDTKGRKSVVHFAATFFC